MNLLQQLIGVAFNVLQMPFANETFAQNENSVYRSLQNAPMFPLNLLRAGGAVSCNTRLFKMGENELKLSLLPRGFCPNCCSVKLGRDVRFVLYNKANPNKGVMIKPHNIAGAAGRAGVDSTWPTIIFIHGFTEPSPGESGRTIIDAYLSRQENFNVILMDWSELSAFPWYKSAVQNVKLIGKVLTEFIEVFNDSGEIPIGKLHLVGFSLGSHIASYAGKQLRRDLKIPRITALDPAFPEFSLRDSSGRLTETDAEYIDVIHTDSGVLGLPIPVGHADFYPNGGRALQPGCQPSYLVNQRLVDQVLACSHVRAWRLYAESIRNLEAFPASKCKIWRGPNKQCNFTVDAFMGYANQRARGQFYLLTKFKYPFSKTATEQLLVQ